MAGQTKANTTLCLSSQLDLLVKPTPVPHLFLVGRVIAHYFLESVRKPTKAKTKEITLLLSFISVIWKPLYDHHHHLYVF